MLMTLYLRFWTHDFQKCSRQPPRGHRKSLQVTTVLAEDTSEELLEWASVEDSYIGATLEYIWIYRCYIPSGYLLHSHGKWPIEIDGLPSYKMVIFHGYVK